MFSSTRWYFVLTIGFLVNFFIVVFLVVYIVRRRHHHGLMRSVETPKNGSGPMGNGSTRKKSWSNGSAVNNNRGYSPVKPDSSSLTTVPFHDYESTSEDEEMFRKPFTDHKWILGPRWILMHAVKIECLVLWFYSFHGLILNEICTMLRNETRYFEMMFGQKKLGTIIIHSAAILFVNLCEKYFLRK